MRRNVMGKQIAIFCVIMMIALGCLGCGEEKKEAEVVKNGWRNFTLTDLGEKSVIFGSKYVELGDYAKNLDKTRFNVKVSFGEEGSCVVYNNLAIRTSSQGFSISDSEHLYRDTVDKNAYGDIINPTEVDVADPLTDYVILQFTTEYIDNDNDGEKDDLKVGIYINGHLVKDKYLYSNDGVSKISSRLTLSGYELESLAFSEE